MRTNLFKPLILSFFLSLAINATYSQPFALRQTHVDGIYKTNEKITFSINRDDQSTDSLYIKVWKNNNNFLLTQKILPTEASFDSYTGLLKEPGSMMMQVTSGKSTRGIGAIVDPAKIKTGTPFPKDFESYWANEKKALKALPMDARLRKVDAGGNGYECFDAELNCTGPKPARGYFARPVKAKKKSLPIVLLVHAAGVKGSWCRSKVEDAMRYAQMGKGALCFDLNAHGMLNGQPDEYYNQLEAGELKEYWNQGIESREGYYFRGMYLRLIRTLDYLEQQPEWDGKLILVIGESQGGGQALAAAGLDPHVSAVVATVPAMCDFGGTLVGRKGGWPQPFEQHFDKEKMLNVVSYFDNANLLKYAKAKIVVEIGLIDNTCPSTSVYAAINEAKGEKIIYAVPNREHHEPAGSQHDEWVNNVYKPKTRFIENYLKQKPSGVKISAKN